MSYVTALKLVAGLCVFGVIAMGGPYPAWQRIQTALNPPPPLIPVALPCLRQVPPGATLAALSQACTGGTAQALPPHLQRILDKARSTGDGDAAETPAVLSAERFAALETAVAREPANAQLTLSPTGLTVTVGGGEIAGTDVSLQVTSAEVVAAVFCVMRRGSCIRMVARLAK